MNLTIAQIHRLNVALTSIARGFPNGDGKPSPVIRTAAAKIAVARNLRRLREALEPAEQEMIAERNRLMEQLPPDAASQDKDLSPAQTRQFADFVKDVNETKIDVELEPVNLEDLDIEAFSSGEAIEALSVVEPYLDQ